MMCVLILYFLKDVVFAKKKIKFADEAHFDLAVQVNKQTYLIWGTENQQAHIE